MLKGHHPCMLESMTHVLRKWRTVLDGEGKHTEGPLNHARFDESREQAGQVSRGYSGAIYLVPTCRMDCGRDT